MLVLGELSKVFEMAFVPYNFRYVESVLHFGDLAIELSCHGFLRGANLVVHRLVSPLFEPFLSLFNL